MTARHQSKEPITLSVSPEGSTKKFWSHKVSDAGPRYEIAISQGTSDIVIAYGPFLGDPIKMFLF